MAGTGWDSSDLLTRFNDYAQRPDTNDPLTDAQKYRRLADGQNQVIMECALLMGRVLYATPAQMTTTDGGYTYTYAVDGSGYAGFPLAGSIYPTRNAIPGYPWVPQRDYLDEGTQIRGLYYTVIPVAPWFYGILSPAPISASVQPVLQPPMARVLIVIQAVKGFAEEGNRDVQLAATMAARWDEQWKRWATSLRKHLRGPRSLGPVTTGGGAWNVGITAGGGGARL